MSSSSTAEDDPLASGNDQRRTRATQDSTRNNGGGAGDDDGNKDDPSSFSESHRKRKYEPEQVKPEWLKLPPELLSIDFSQDNAVAWDKYQPYSTIPPTLTPVDCSPTFTSEGHQRALCFQLHAIDGRARAGTIHFPNSASPVPTPRFMPVGTKGTLKGVLPSEIETAMCPMILANTYHLALQPGTELIQSVFGGLPRFMGGEESVEDTSSDEITTYGNKGKRRRLFNLLTDSGGFQMVSLAALSVVTEHGVVFESPYTKGECMTLRPEDSIKCQNEIGADVIMQLDDVISSVENDPQRFRLATMRTLRWYDRCVAAHQRPDVQNLYPILQGHLDISKGGLREICLAGFRHRDLQGDNGSTDGKNWDQRTIPGFAIGGLAGGESKDEFWKVVDHACRHLPDNRPRYLMGVGYPLDLVVCTALGVDQFDCVYPTRTARFGVALVDGLGGQLKLKQHEFATQTDVVLQEGCLCPACSRQVSRARLHALVKSPNNILGIQLLTQHNICYMMGLVQRMRLAVLRSNFQKFVHEFLQAHFVGPMEIGTDEKIDAKIPQWVRDALTAAGVALTI